MYCLCSLFIQVVFMHTDVQFPELVMFLDKTRSNQNKYELRCPLGRGGGAVGVYFSFLAEFIFRGLVTKMPWQKMSSPTGGSIQLTFASTTAAPQRSSKHSGLKSQGGCTLSKRHETWIPLLQRWGFLSSCL